MILRPLLPGPGEPIEVGAPGARERMRALYAPPRRDWLRLNLVASVDGSARGDDGVSESLSSAADRALLGTIRSQADVVLIGAESFRAEGYLLPRRCRLAVITGSGELGAATVSRGGGAASAVGDDGRADAVTLTVLAPDTAEGRVRETLPAGVEIDLLRLHAREGRMDPVEAVGALRAEGFASIVCEGGPSLAAQLLDAGLVDEICLSTSPRIAGTALPALGGAGARPLTLTSLLADDAGGLYARWAVGAA